MPHPVPVSAEALEGEGVYVLDDGTCMWLYIGRAVSNNELELWFGARGQVYQSCQHYRQNTGRGARS